MVDQPNYRRRSIRIKGYDYSLPGGYFITIVTWKRENLFGQMEEGKLRRSALGEIAYLE